MRGIMEQMLISLKQLRKPQPTDHLASPLLVQTPSSKEDHNMIDIVIEAKLDEEFNSAGKDDDLIWLIPSELCPSLEPKAELVVQSVGDEINLDKSLSELIVLEESTEDDGCLDGLLGGVHCCTKGVRQNVSKIFVFDLPPAKPPDRAQEDKTSAHVKLLLVPHSEFNSLFLEVANNDPELLKSWVECGHSSEQRVHMRIKSLAHEIKSDHMFEFSDGEMLGWCLSMTDAIVFSVTVQNSMKIVLVPAIYVFYAWSFLSQKGKSDLQDTRDHAHLDKVFDILNIMDSSTQGNGEAIESLEDSYLALLCLDVSKTQCSICATLSQSDTSSRKVDTSTKMLNCDLVRRGVALRIQDALLVFDNQSIHAFSALLISEDGLSKDMMDSNSEIKKACALTSTGLLFGSCFHARIGSPVQCCICFEVPLVDAEGMQCTTENFANVQQFGESIKGSISCKGLKAHIWSSQPARIWNINPLSDVRMPGLLGQMTYSIQIDFCALQFSLNQMF